MANELKITETQQNYQRGNLVLRNHAVCIGQTLSPTGTQANSAAFSANTNMIKVQSSIACYVRVWDSAGVLAATNGEYLAADEIADYEVSPGQILSCKVI